MVVSLDADLDLAGVEWTNIGCTDEKGEVKLSAAKYTVSFVVTPDDLTNVVIKVNDNACTDIDNDISSCRLRQC